MRSGEAESPWDEGDLAGCPRVKWNCYGANRGDKSFLGRCRDSVREAELGGRDKGGQAVEAGGMGGRERLERDSE